jgi:hypothetical protein
MKRMIFAVILISVFCILIAAQRSDETPLGVDPVPFD